MPNDDIGYSEEPRNGNGIIRARTTKQIRAWEMPKSLKSLESLNEELGKIEFPGNYILFEGNKKVYVGQAKNIYIRLKTHINNPDEKIKNWDRVILINDGRPSTQSDFNDEVVRKSLEGYLRKLLKSNKYMGVCTSLPYILNVVFDSANNLTGRNRFNGNRLLNQAVK
jgi:hypothetical protein